MTGRVPIAFYAPLKSPDHPVPSGDRTVARLLWQALERAGFSPTLASRLRSLDLLGDEAVQRRLEGEAAREAEVFASSAAGADRPRLWFTYHAYYKAPDHLGPLVSERLGIPYVVAEASRAPKRASGPWAQAHRASERGLDRADILFASTPHDAVVLDRLRPPGQRIVRLPPFLDVDAWPVPPVRATPEAGAPPQLLSVAMMRPGDKLASYAILASALKTIRDRAWTLTIVGDGPARADVERLLAPFGDRVRFTGEVTDRSTLAGLYGESDCLVWPAVNEAYGMVLLEAQLMSCPVLAGRSGGVASVVRDGETGWLVEPGNADAFGRALYAIVDTPASLAASGQRAAAFVRREHGLDGAADRLRETLAPLLLRAPA